MSQYTVGMDEVGRGPAAGPVTVCGVCWISNEDPMTILPELRDSKQLQEDTRERWASSILGHSPEKFVYAVASVDASHVDQFGIKDALQSAAKQVLDSLTAQSDVVRVIADFGLPLPEEAPPATHIKGGDAKEPLIAMASIIAKVERDAMMRDLAATYPSYQWEKNNGYLTRAHEAEIRKHGPTPVHRKTFLRRIV